MKDPTLADLMDEAEISQLRAEYGPSQRWRMVLEMSGPSFDDWLRKMVTSPNRRGEVVLAIQRPDGRMLLHTKRFYPEGIYRLPSGGVHPDEPVLSGVIREAKEEGVMVDLLHKAGELGLLMIDIPEKYGGLELDKATSMLVSEIISKGGVASETASLAGHLGLGRQEPVVLNPAPQLSCFFVIGGGSSYHYWRSRPGF